MEAVKGVADGLRYALQWLTPRPTGTAAEATQGDLYVEVNRRPVWGERTARASRGLPWTWIELLEHLARQWPAIVWEETDPLGLNEQPWRLRHAAEVRWREAESEGTVDYEQRSVLRFERSHNLAFAPGGAAFPALWVMREGADMVLAADRWVVRRPFALVKSTLESLCNEIAERLVSIDDERAVVARREWADRDKVPFSTVLRFATHLSQQAIDKIEAGHPANDVWGISYDDMQPTAELAAARMFGDKAPAEVISAALEWIRHRPIVSTQDLDALSRQVEPLSANSEHRAFVQGYQTAVRLRTIPGIVEDSGRVEPERLLTQLRIRIDEVDLNWPGIEAVACWSALHGPAILLNLAGKHVQGIEGRRATLAHELCHLLVDRRRLLPLAEVLGGQTPFYAERRANAFAAELLLPREIAGAALRGGDAAAQVAMLKKRYGVSAEIIAWQAVRSEAILSRTTLAHLRALVADTVRFDRALTDR